MTNPFKFLQEARVEIGKVVWPSRNETFVTTLMVIFLVILVTLFFFFVDKLIGFALSVFLNLFY